MPIPKKWMNITLRDGKQLRFEFPVQFEEENVARNIEEALKLPSITVSAGDVLYIVPTTAIQLITVSPAPKRLPKTTIRGAKLVS